jgi:phosphoheptose isomerase
MLSDDQALEVVRSALDRSTNAKRRLESPLLARVVAATRLIDDALKAGNKVLICGNGGSAADAQHIAAELTGRYVTDRPGLAAVALTTDTSALTAIANDYGFDYIFARQVEAVGKSGDVLVGISTSGNSPNVVRALETARAAGLSTIAMTGARPSSCHQLADVTLFAPDVETARIQECHIFLGHAMCELLDSTSPPMWPPRKAFSTWDEQLLAMRAGWKAAGLRVVLTNGAFDLLHSGHLSSFRDARHHGDVLVVALNTDDTVRRQKGESRPVRGQVDRLQLVAALDVVDAAVLFDDDDACPIIEWLQPDVWVKGGDYAERDASTIPEVAVMRRLGGSVEFVKYVDGQSTTATLGRIRTTT